MTENGWRFDKHISIGHIVTTLAVASTAMFWLANIDKRVDLNTQAINHNVGQIEKVEDRQSARFGEILNRLDRIETFLRER